MRISDWSSDVCSSDLKGLATAVGDEGGFAPNLASTRAALDFIAASVDQAGFKLGSDVVLALDCAATEFFKNGKYEISGEGLSRSEEHTSEIQSLMRISYAVFGLKKTKHTPNH